MVLFKGTVDGYDVEIKTTEMYDSGELTSDDDEPSADYIIQGKGVDIKTPIWGEPPKTITDGMVRRFLRGKGL